MDFRLPLIPVHGRAYDMARDEMYTGWRWISLFVSASALHCGLGGAIRVQIRGVRSARSAKRADDIWSGQYDKISAAFRPSEVHDT